MLKASDTGHFLRAFAPRSPQRLLATTRRQVAQSAGRSACQRRIATEAKRLRNNASAAAFKPFCALVLIEPKRKADPC